METINQITTNNRDETEQKYARSDKYPYKEFCNCCGRGIKGEPKFWIQMIEPGDVIPANITEEEISKAGKVCMGAYPIGSECAKRYPKEFIIKAK